MPVVVISVASTAREKSPHHRLRHASLGPTRAKRMPMTTPLSHRRWHEAGMLCFWVLGSGSGAMAASPRPLISSVPLLGRWSMPYRPRPGSRRLPARAMAQPRLGLLSQVCSILETSHSGFAEIVNLSMATYLPVNLPGLRARVVAPPRHGVTGVPQVGCFSCSIRNLVDPVVTSCPFFSVARCRCLTSSVYFSRNQYPSQK